MEDKHLEFFYHIGMIFLKYIIFLCICLVTTQATTTTTTEGNNEGIIYHILKTYFILIKQCLQYG